MITKIKEKYIDVTDEWMNKSISFGDVKDAKYIIINNKKYAVNNINRIIHDFNEERVAKWISTCLCMNVEYLPNISEDKNIELGDYLINKKEIWELKTIRGNSKRTLDSSIKNKKNQSAIFIFDLTYSKMNNETAIKQVHDIFRRREWVYRIILKRKDKLLKVFERI